LPLLGRESTLVTGGARDTGAYQRLCCGGEERSRARHLLIRVVLQRFSQIATANPFVDPEEYQRFLVEEEGKYLKQLEEERVALR